MGRASGQTLQGWPLALIQPGLRDGFALKRLAAEVGDDREAALSRTFRAKAGQAQSRGKTSGSAPDLRSTDEGGVMGAG